MKIEGLDQVLNKLNRLTPQMRKDIKAGNKEASTIIADEARARAPKRSGRLAKTIKPFGTLKGGGVQAGGAKTPYAKPIHFGTGPRSGRRGPHNISPNPFLFDATDKRRNDVIKKYETLVERTVQEAGL